MRRLGDFGEIKGVLGGARLISLVWSRTELGVKDLNLRGVGSGGGK